jgi:hypothetical protein
MRFLRMSSAATACVALTGAAVLLAAAPASAATVAAHRFLVHGVDVRDVDPRAGQSMQQAGGFFGFEGPATTVKAAAAALSLSGIGNTALYTGAGETGSGFLIVSGDDLPVGTDFQVMGMTAANVENNTNQEDVVYSDNSGKRAAIVAPGTDQDITPVDVDYAAYPVGSTPPPDNRGLNPAAQFTWTGGKS